MNVRFDLTDLTDPISAADVLFDLTTPGDEEIEDKKLLAKVNINIHVPSLLWYYCVTLVILVC